VVACRSTPELGGMVQDSFDRLFPSVKEDKNSSESLEELLAAKGFDAKQHQLVRRRP